MSQSINSSKPTHNAKACSGTILPALNKRINHQQRRYHPPLKCQLPQGAWTPTTASEATNSRQCSLIRRKTSSSILREPQAPPLTHLIRRLSSRSRQKMSTAHLTSSSSLTTRWNCHAYPGDRTQTFVAPRTMHPASSSTAKRAPPLLSCRITILRTKTQPRSLATRAIPYRLPRPRNSSLSTKYPRCPCLRPPHSETMSTGNLTTKASSNHLNLQLINSSRRNMSPSSRCLWPSSGSRRSKKSKERRLLPKKGRPQLSRSSKPSVITSTIF